MALECNPDVPVMGDQNPELCDMTKRFWPALSPGLPVVVFAMGGMLFDLERWIPQQASKWIQLMEFQHFTNPLIARLLVQYPS